MLGALPAIGFLSTGVGVGVGQIAAYGAIAGFSATLTGPPNLSTGGTTNGYDYQGSQVGSTRATYDFLGSHVPNYTGGYDYLGSGVGNTSGYDFLGMGGSYNLTGHLSNAVWNLNAAPWNEVSYGAICGCGQNNYSPMQSYTGVNYTQQSAFGSMGSVQAYAPSATGFTVDSTAYASTVATPSGYPAGYNPNSEFPYNNVQYNTPNPPYPADYATQLGSYDASRSFGSSGPIIGSIPGYSQFYTGIGFPAPQSTAVPFGYCQPAYTNPANYVYPAQTSQTYTLQSQANGMFNYGSTSSSYEPYTPPAPPTPPPPPPYQPPVEVNGCPTDGSGRVLYPAVPPPDECGNFVDASQTVASRCVGSAENVNVISYSGNDPRVNGDGHADERTTVWWALSSNDRLRFNADNGEFFITYPDGSNRAVDTLSNLLSVRQASGWDGQVAYKAFGDHLQEVMVTGDLIYPPYQPGASALTTRQFGTQWDNIFPRPNNAALFGYQVPNLGPQTTILPANGLG